METQKLIFKVPVGKASTKAAEAEIQQIMEQHKLNITIPELFMPAKPGDDIFIPINPTENE